MAENTDEPTGRIATRIIDQLAGVTLTADEAEQIVSMARSRINATRPAPLTPVEQTGEHVHTHECAMPGSSCPDA